MTRAIDCLVNVDMGDVKQPEWMVRVKEDYFRGGRMDFSLSFDELLRRLPDIELATDKPLHRRDSNFVSGLETLPITFTPAPVEEPV